MGLFYLLAHNLLNNYLMRRLFLLVGLNLMSMKLRCFAGFFDSDFRWSYNLHLGVCGLDWFIEGRARRDICGCLSTFFG